jgi:cardiolipin synthase A/B
MRFEHERNIFMQHLVTLVKPFLLLSLLVSLLNLGGGCASLPNVSKMMAETPDTNKPHQIVSAQGPLSDNESHVIIEQLKQTVPPTDFLTGYLAVMDTWGKTPLTSGNKVILLADDTATYAAMFKAIQNAKDHINIETFFIEDDEVGHRFSELLQQKQAQGVQVNLIYDSMGSNNTPVSFFKHLQDAGINVVEFHSTSPPGTPGPWLQLRFDHRKILIVDGTLAITGGVNVSRGSSMKVHEGKKGKKASVTWRDTDVQIEGPAVAQLQKLFLDTWQQRGGQKLSQRSYLPKLKEEGNVLVRIVANSPGEYKRLTYVMYVSAITFARHSVHLTTAYFVPDEQILRALTDAAKRGVDVKIVLPSISDSPMAVDAGRSYYSELLKAGVKLYEYRKAILHAKTAVIDGVWSTVGSTNMDYWSFLSDDEINAVILDRQFATEMEALFEKDIGQSEQIKLEDWKKRSVFHRLGEWFAHLFVYWL